MQYVLGASMAHAHCLLGCAAAPSHLLPALERVLQYRPGGSTSHARGTIAGEAR
jgi:hypothetical protein